jgi:hypothetical protein
VPAVDRLEIGYTWYAASRQRSAVNTTAKLMLLQHAFETLGAQLVGWRTDNFNFASQRAIERLGARKDGILRHHGLRRDGTVRDTVMYSLTARMARGQGPPGIPARQAALKGRPPAGDPFRHAAQKAHHDRRPVAPAAHRRAQPEPRRRAGRGRGDALLDGGQPGHVSRCG